MGAMEFPAGVLPRVSSAQSPTGFALRILKNGAVVAEIGGYVVMTRAKRSQGTVSRFCEIGLRGKELEQSGTVTQRQNLNKQLRQSIEMTQPELVDHGVDRVLVTGQRTNVDSLVRRGRYLS
jgi:hypothetical protein